MDEANRLCTVYILRVGPSLNFEASSETRGPEGMLSIRTVLHFRLVDLTDQFQDIPVRAVLGILIPVDLLAVPLVSAGRRQGRGEMSAHTAKIVPVPHAPSTGASSGRAAADVEVSLSAAGGLLERRFASFAKEQCGSDC